MEQWKDVIGYEGVYQVSSFGRIRLINCNYTRWSPQSNKMISVPRAPKILAQFGHFSGPYRAVRMNGKIVRAHQIVAKAFIPNPDNKPQVNHINGVRTIIGLKIWSGLRHLRI